MTALVPRGDQLRVMMTTDAVGGVWTYAVTLAQALAACGVLVDLVTLGPRPTPAQRRMIAANQPISLTETDLLLEWQDPGGQDMPRARTVLEELTRELQPDLVHLNGFREALFDWDTAIVVVAHSCVVSWARACGSGDFLQDDRWQTYARTVRAALRSADAWIAPTAAFRDILQAVHGCPTPGEVIWNGAAPAPEISGKRRPVILAAGRVWDAAKNIRGLIDSATEIDWPIRVAGPHHDIPSSAPGIEMLGALSHRTLLAEMRAAEIFVSPALYEPFGLCVLEAAMSGCALVLSDIASFRELWDGVALFVDPGDAGALVTALNLLCRDQEARQRLQHAARERARRYPLHRTAEAYLQLYRRVIDRHRPVQRSRIAGALA